MSTLGPAAAATGIAVRAAKPGGTDLGPATKGFQYIRLAEHCSISNYIVGHMERAVTGDLVRERAHLFLGSRLKRLGERMQAEVIRVAEAAGLPIQPSQYPLLATLDRYGPIRSATWLKPCSSASRR